MVAVYQEQVHATVFRDIEQALSTLFHAYNKGIEQPVHQHLCYSISVCIIA